MRSNRKYALIGAVSAMLFCLSVGVLLRSCEMRALGIHSTIATFAELREIRSAIQRSRHAVPDRR